MKKMLYRLFPSLLVLALPAAALAETTVSSTSIMRFRQNDLPGFDKKTMVPVTEFVGLDATKLADGNLSAHIYGWGQVELADRDSNDTKTDGNLTYGYLQYRFKSANAQAKAGRFFVNEGILNEQVDGVGARTDLPYGFAISGFGGATVHTTSIPYAGNDGKGDGIWGGRMSYRYAGKLEVGLAGVYESTAPMPKTSPTLPTAFGDHRLIGYDLYLNPHPMLQLSGQTSYNPTTEHIAENSYLLQLRPLKDLAVGATWEEHHDRDYFFDSLLFSNMVRNLSQQSHSLGATATYTFKVAEVSADFKHYTRDIGKAERFGGEVRSNSLFNNTVRAGVSYHYLRSSGDFAIVPASDASGSFHEIRGWAMRDTKTYFASGDVIAYVFKEKVDNKDAAWEGTASVGYHITPQLAVSGDISYGQNPDYNDELKGLIRVTYNFTAKGGSK
ncbi:hypothetical protein [Geomesophilobacter sediminis]|uniref:Porin n=1 Tax=Geomesophilobacter sediminis TaxID=2798584 RepID=A0A8J7M379_9BACT|nr:hypothetical protein [Geomesophilobacter sediminis]MBJ6727935.1 hypothetical protein [Geomesophilobacter sediminis]